MKDPTVWDDERMQYPGSNYYEETGVLEEEWGTLTASQKASVWHDLITTLKERGESYEQI